MVSRAWPNGGVTREAQIVVDAGQRRLDWRRRWIRRGGTRGTQGAVFLDRQNDPAIRSCGSCADATCTHSTAAHRPIPVALIVCLPGMARGPRISFRRACLDFRLAHLDCQICNGAGSAPRVFHAQPRTHRASGVLQAARLRRRCAGFVDWSAGSAAASCGGAGG